MRTTSSTKVSVRRKQGFKVYVLQNENVEIKLVPELGAKIISLVNLRTGREWMSYPTGGAKLFCNRPGDDFATSTLVGWDECLPTIASCVHKGRSLPDHGEVWAIPWTINRESLNAGVLNTSVTLPVSPFHFERSISLLGNEIQLNYTLKNLGNEPEHFLWAMHPLLPIYPGDTMELTAESRKLLGDPPWLTSLDFKATQPACAKTYAGPLREGRAAVKNRQSGDGITFSWDTQLNPTLGIWLTRGGWNGQHHQALEPSNGSPDALTIASDRNQCGLIAPHSSLNWQVTIKIEPALSMARFTRKKTREHSL